MKTLSSLAILSLLLAGTSAFAQSGYPKEWFGAQPAGKIDAAKTREFSCHVRDTNQTPYPLIESNCRVVFVLNGSTLEARLVDPKLPLSQNPKNIERWKTVLRVPTARPTNQADLNWQTKPNVELEPYNLQLFVDGKNVLPRANVITYHAGPKQHNFYFGYENSKEVDVEFKLIEEKSAE